MVLVAVADSLRALLLGCAAGVRRLRRRHDRHRHADADRQHDLHGRLRSRGRQRQRDRRNGLRQGGDGRRELQAGPPDPGRPRRGGQHHQGRDEGHCHRLGSDRRRLAIRQFHRRDRGGQRREPEHDDHGAVQVLLRLPHRGRSDGLDRPADRRGSALPVQLDADPRGRPSGVLHRQGGPRPVQGPGDHGRHEEAGLRPRRGHLHEHGPERADRPGPVGHRRSGGGRIPARPLRLGRVPGGDDPRRGLWPCSWPMPAARGTTPRR